ncbi:MAG TPA: tetratricopeptide repeat protein [Bacteroidia bacterium]|nr:tetratricopeptide repeat protein [Bacteroidia bacterium]
MAKKVVKNKKDGAGTTSRKPAPRGFFRRNSFSIVLFLLTFVVFGNGIFNEYALDDEFYTNSTNGGNKVTAKGFKGLHEVFTTRTFYNNDGSGYSYRPVALASFAIEIGLFGESPHMSHFINVLLYGLTVVILFRLMRRWFSTQGDWFSFFIALLFLVHPLHTEVVDNIKCRDELLALLFGFLALLLVWKHMETGKKHYLLLYPLCVFAGMLSKHTIIPVIALFPVAMWFFSNTDWKKIVLYMIPALLAMMANGMIERFGLPATSRTLQAFENPIPHDSALLFRFATAAYVSIRYLYLHFVPYPLVYYYGFNYVPVVGISNPLVILSVIVYAALGILALRGLKKKTILSFGILFYLVNIAAYSNLLRPAPGIMAERYTYASSLGFCIVVIFLVFKWTKLAPENFRWKAPAYSRARFILVGIAVLFAVRSIGRNEDWEDKETLYGGDMETLHESAKANMLYGALLSSRAMGLHLDANQKQAMGNDQQAKQEEAESRRMFIESRIYYRQATNIADYYHTAWSNLGTTYFFVDQPDSAIPYFRRAVKIRPDYTEGLFNLGMAYDKTGKLDSAIYFFSSCIKNDSTYMQGYEQWARVKMQEENDPQGALALLHTAARKKPDSEVPWNNIATIYLQQHDTASAAGAMEMAAQINPSNIQRLANLARYFQMHQNIMKYNQYQSMYEEEMRKQKPNQR